jgi:hypothetical protein
MKRPPAVSRPRSTSPSDQESGTLEGGIVDLALRGKLAKAARKAIRTAKGRGLPITFKKGNQVVKEHADGRIEVLETLAAPEYVLPKGVKIISRK